MTDYIDHDAILRKARSMEIFSDGEPTFRWGAWKSWRSACQEAGKIIPPAEFKEGLKRTND